MLTGIEIGLLNSPASGTSWSPRTCARRRGRRRSRRSGIRNGPTTRPPAAAVTPRPRVTRSDTRPRRPPAAFRLLCPLRLRPRRTRPIERRRQSLPAITPREMIGEGNDTSVTCLSMPERRQTAKSDARREKHQPWRKMGARSKARTNHIQPLSWQGLSVRAYTLSVLAQPSKLCYECDDAWLSRRSARHIIVFLPASENLHISACSTSMVSALSYISLQPLHRLCGVNIHSVAELPPETGRENEFVGLDRGWVLLRHPCKRTPWAD